MSKILSKFLDTYNFSTLRDVDLTSLTEEDIIVYDSLTQKFKNKIVPKFGKDYQANSVATEMSTTGALPIVHNSFVKDFVIGGNYLIFATFEMQMSTILKGIVVDLDVNGTNIGSQFRNDISTSIWTPAVCIMPYTATAVQNTIELSFSRDGNKNVSLRKSNLIAWRVE